MQYSSQHLFKGQVWLQRTTLIAFFENKQSGGALLTEVKLMRVSPYEVNTMLITQTM